MDDADRISDLPEPLIHHIMSFLSAPASIKISILSKKFYSAWISFPVLVFDYYYMFNRPLFSARRLIDRSSRERTTNLFLNSIVRSLRLRKLNGVRLQRLIFKASLSGFESDLRVEELLNYAELNGVRDLILEDPHNFKYRRVPNPYIFRMDRSIFSAKSIVKLHLKGFDLKPEDIILNFPSVEKFRLDNCCGFRSIKLSGEKLRLVEFDSCNGLQKIHIDAPKSLESFSYSGEWRRFDEMDLSSCESVRFFELKNEDIVGGEWGECYFLLNKVNLYFENLKDLELDLCDCDAQFQAPNLVSFKYRGCLTMKTPLVISNDGLHADLFFDSYGRVSFPGRMRDFIRSFRRYCQTLSLHCLFDMDLIYAEDMRKISDPPSYNIKHLKIEFKYKLKSLVELVDGLLWLVPHPNTITITITTSQIHSQCHGLVFRPFKPCGLSCYSDPLLQLSKPFAHKKEKLSKEFGRMKVYCLKESFYKRMLEYLDFLVLGSWFTNEGASSLYSGGGAYLEAIQQSRYVHMSII